jgi:hypothetical protein
MQSGGFNRCCQQQQQQQQQQYLTFTATVTWRRKVRTLKFLRIREPFSHGHFPMHPCHTHISGGRGEGGGWGTFMERKRPACRRKWRQEGAAALPPPTMMRR